MKRSSIVTLALFAAVSVVSWYVLAGSATPAARAHDGPGAGELLILAPDGTPAGFCPLEHTAVRAEISGFLSRVTLTQKFGNTSKDPVEAIYVFPLPDRAAVDRMTMKVGDRTVVGKIKRREEARAIYDAARNAGKAASLLDQERPNIFTQSVANIMPGENIEITISYVETLAYEDGTYSFVYPMVVGPRYIPGNPTGRTGGGSSPDTDRVPDASKITPPVAVPGTRAGHDISMEVVLDAGVPILDVASTLHEVDVQRTSNRSALVALKTKNVLPNKDFILKYSVAGGKIADAVMAHRDGDEGLRHARSCSRRIVLPPKMSRPRELVFVVDTSGSMSGFPLDKAKETMALAFEALHPDDTFNLITFAGDTAVLFPAPVPASAANLAKAKEFLDGRRGGGGTEMMTAIRTALDPSDKQNHVRIVCFMTDGYVGNEGEILGRDPAAPERAHLLVRHRQLGQSVPAGPAWPSRDAARSNTSRSPMTARRRRGSSPNVCRTPCLTDISIDWGGLQLVDVYPSRVMDLFGAKPIVVVAKYTTPGKATVKIRGKQAGRDIVREVAVELPAVEKAHDTLGVLWARQKVDDLERQDYAGVQNGNPRAEIREAITELGLRHGLMTQFTSFVAVEEMVINQGGQTRRVEVPVEMPDGVSYEGVFGDDKRFLKKSKLHAGRGYAGGVGGGVVASSPVARSPARVNEQNRPATVDEAVKEEPAPPPEATYRVKLDSTLSAMVAAKRTGTVEVQIFLSDTSDETRKALSKLGVEILLEPKSGKMVIARIPIAKLEELAKLVSVTYVTEYRG